MPETRVISGYRPVPDAEPCPFCKHRHFALEDDGDPETLKVLCWCGARARIRRDDPELSFWPGGDTHE